MKPSLIPFGLGLLGLSTVALAQGWSSFDAAFPGLPCSDGWAACIVDGTVVSPGMVLDDGARPHPADMRLGFFDLDPLPGLSPFVGLSDYPSDPAPEAVAVNTPRSEPAATRPLRAEREPAGDDGGGGSARPFNGNTEPLTTRTTTEPVRTEPASTEPARTEPPSTASTARTEPASTARTEPVYTPPPTTARTEPVYTPPPVAAAEPVYTPPPTTARTEPPPTTARTEPPPTTARTEPAVADASPVNVSRPQVNMQVVDESCDDLVALEAPSMMGELGVGRRKCIEGRIGGSVSQTDKNKLSRVLIIDAEARGDKSDWERLMKRHLEDIDRSDPDLCFKYALHLSRGGVGRAFGVIKWADYAMENKQNWSGTTYKKRVYSLYQLRAQAANKLWQNAEEEYVKDHTDENESKVKKYRGQTKDFSREWLDYARASDQDVKTPLAVCVSASGSTEFCSG